MTSPDHWQWPALLGSEQKTQVLNIERGVWGKAHGASSDFRLLAATSGFYQNKTRLEASFQLGSEDKPLKGQCWLALNSRYYAIAYYPSRAVDAAERSGFLEKQIIEWRPTNTDIPAAAAALLLLPQVADYHDAVWWDAQEQADWDNGNYVLPLDDCEPVVMDDISALIKTSVEDLLAAVSPDNLSQFYASVLAGHRAVAMPGLSQALPTTALAALLLPLERDKADRFTMVNWLPAQLADAKKLRKRWNAILGSTVYGLARTTPEPTSKHHDQAQRMVEALSQLDPGRLIAGVTSGFKAEAHYEPDLKLAIWGPSSAGKTILMAQLHLTTHGSDSDWDVYPTDGISPGFIDSMRDALANNYFPYATAVGDDKEITYEFVRRDSDTKVSLAVEDRAGKDHETLHDGSRQRMNTADGLVLLIDPMRDSGPRINEVTRLFERMIIERREQNRPDRKDPRPIAICVSKADTLIETMADYQHACEEPDAFIRGHRAWHDLLSLLDKYCANYRFFPVSAVGVSPRYGIIESNTFYDEKLRLRVKNNLRPFNLLEPFVWIINELGVGE